MLKTASLGYPRIGQQRELKKATESYWKGEISSESLEKAAHDIREKNWRTQHSAGIHIIPSNDFSFYDAVLDVTALVGAVPPRYGWKGNEVDIDTYFAMARGSANAPAMEMTKWFDTNYHYIVPEFYKDQRFKLASRKPFAEYKEAQALGIKTRPVLVGPVTYLSLGKAKDASVNVWSLLDSLVSVYIEALGEFKKLGVDWVQIDEPILVMDLTAEQRAAFQKAYSRIHKEVPGLSILLATYFGPLGSNLSIVSKLPVEGLHIDLVRAPKELPKAVAASSKMKVLSLGVIEGRNIWKSDLNQIIRMLKPAVKKIGA